MKRDIVGDLDLEGQRVHGGDRGAARRKLVCSFHSLDLGYGSTMDLEWYFRHISLHITDAVISVVAPWTNHGSENVNWQRQVAL